MAREQEQREAYRRIVAVIVTIVVIVLAFFVVRPFLVSILSAAALAYIFYPLYLNILRYLPKKIPAKQIASILTCTLIVLLVLVPTAFVTVFLTFELKNGYMFLQGFFASSQRPLLNLPPLIGQWVAFLPPINEIAMDLTGQLIEILQGILRGIPNLALSIFITVFSIYYFLKHGKDIYAFFSELIPLPEGRYKQILKRFDNLTRGMIMGQLVVGLIQGILAWLGYMLLGLPIPLLWAFLTALISMIPMLGAALVWLPITVYLFILATVTGEYWRGITLLLYGSLVISLIDNVLKPKIIGESANIHPLIIMFGILGGIQLFGIAGILIGPLVLTIFDVFIEIYKETL